MNNHDSQTTAPNASLLAREFTRRITQLGISRRELVKRTGLSRQTLHNIEHGGRIELRPATLAALDAGLMWHPGTSFALSNGDVSVLETADASMHADREHAYRWRIVERISKMNLGDLERLVSIMESETFDTADNGEPLTTDAVISLIETSVMERIERRLAEYRNNGQSD